MENGQSVASVPDYTRAMNSIYREAGFVIIPEFVWDDYCKYERQVIIPSWYWINIASFVVDYEAALDRLKIITEDKDE